VGGREGKVRGMGREEAKGTHQTVWRKNDNTSYPQMAIITLPG